MNNLLTSISHHSYLLVALVCFAEAMGLPLPAALALLTAGAVAAYGGLHFYLVFALGLLSMIAGDVILYFLGRVSGWALLGFLCRLSANPESCILRSAEYFYRRGKQTLLFAKFIPGINTMSPPLAGSMKMRLGDFLQYDAAGAALYVGAYSLAGYLFSDA
jgi:membrane protein DedA with SNARE-associated domain